MESVCDAASLLSEDSTVDLEHLLGPALEAEILKEETSELQKKLLMKHVQGLLEVEGACGEEISAYIYSTSVDHGGNTEVSSGYGQLYRQLAEEAHLSDITRLSSPVEAIISTENEGVSILIQGDEVPLHARGAVCCLPLGCLQAGHLRFEPALPEMTQSRISSLGVGTFEKICIEFEGSFGCDVSAVTPLPGDDDEFYAFRRFVNYSKRCEGRNVWLGYTAVGYASRMHEKRDEEVLTDACKVFQLAFPEDEVHVRDFHLTRWLEDAFSLGSWAVEKPGCKAQNRVEPLLAAPSVFIAGEFVAGPYIGCADGAWRSGALAAEMLALKLSAVGEAR